MALGHIYKNKNKNKKSDGFIAAFLKHGLSPTHKNATQTSKNAAIELIFGMRLVNVIGVAVFLPNAAQSHSIATFL